MLYYKTGKHFLFGLAIFYHFSLYKPHGFGKEKDLVPLSMAVVYRTSTKFCHLSHQPPHPSSH